MRFFFCKKFQNEVWNFSSNKKELSFFFLSFFSHSLHLEELKSFSIMAFLVFFFFFLSFPSFRDEKLWHLDKFPFHSPYLEKEKLWFFKNLFSFPSFKERNFIRFKILYLFFSFEKRNLKECLTIHHRTAFRNDSLSILNGFSKLSF